MLEGANMARDVICKDKAKDLTKLYRVAERFRDSTLEGANKITASSARTK